MDKSFEGSFSHFARDILYLYDNCALKTLHYAVLKLAEENNDLKECDKNDGRIAILHENIKKITDNLNIRLTEILRNRDKFTKSKEI